MAETQVKPAETKPVEDCSNSDVVTKYKLAAEIANFALKVGQGPHIEFVLNTLSMIGAD